jgi:uncharacterized membrane protein
MDHLFVAVVQLAHVLSASLWVGGTVFLDLVVGPATAILPLAQRRLLGQQLGTRAGRFFAIAGAATLLLGIVRGTAAGPIQSLAALGTGYGRTWLAALLLTGGLAVWGARVVGPAAERLYGDACLWTPAGDGGPSPALAAQVRRLALLTHIQLAAFAVVVVCMVLLAEVFS